jgi:hypothetical protein
MQTRVMNVPLQAAMGHGSSAFRRGHRANATCSRKSRSVERRQAERKPHYVSFMCNFKECGEIRRTALRPRISLPAAIAVAAAKLTPATPNKGRSRLEKLH